MKLLPTPAYGSWANPIEAHFGPLRQLTMAHSYGADHAEQTRDLQATCAGERQQPPPDVPQPSDVSGARVRSEKTCCCVRACRAANG